MSEPPDLPEPVAEPMPEADPALFAHALRIAEALIFASDRPIPPARLAQALPPGIDPRAVITSLMAATAGRPVELVEVAGGVAFRTAPDLAPAITKVVEVPRRLPRVAMETLAIIAYHQPVTRAEVESVRGVQLSRGTLDVLLELGLIRMRGRRRSPGRPVTYGTTDAFLEHYGLPSLSDLPGAAELRAAGLLDMDLPADFAIPDPTAGAADEDPLEPEEAAEFHRDYLSEA